MCKYIQAHLFAALLLSVTMDAGDTVKINELKVPEVAKHGASVVLDCDYTLEDSVDHTGLVVKWFFNDQQRPVYQWIPGSKGPQGLGILKGKLNLDYRASMDENTMHRALHILEPSAELSGEYTCVVSTFQNEDKQTKKMLVFVPEQNFQLRMVRAAEGDVKVMCSAENVFPQPNMTIRMEHSKLESRAEVRRERSGLFDVSAVATLSEGDLQEPKDFSCELRIPDANYTARRESIYYPGSGCFVSQASSWILVTVTIILRFISLATG